MGGAGPALNQVGASYSADEIMAIIQNGVEGMPAQKQLTEEEAAPLAKWLSEKK